MPSRDKWGPDGPPEEAYSRITNPERFLPLHDAALEMLAALKGRFDVEHVEDHSLDEDLENFRLVRPIVTLRPHDPEAAPLTVAFTDFPGLSVRFGRWSTERFPICGCDACAEDAAGETERLIEMVDTLTAGGFREAVIYSPAWWKPRRWFGVKPGTSAPQRAYTPLDRLSPEETRRLRRLERRYGRGPTGSWVERVFEGPTHMSRSGSLIEDSRALDMSEGRRRLDLNWKPWPKQDW